jgi:phage baseplate assembly protein W
MSGSTYTATLTGFRVAQLLTGDTIERVALRELGDASRWRTLVSVNGLAWPFLTDDPTQASAAVLLTTGTIKVPAAQPAGASGVVDATLFGTDLLLQNGQLQVVNGDFATVSGIDNLVAAIARRLVIYRGALPYYKTYGCLIRRLLGKKLNAALTQLAAAYASSAVQADPRIDSIQSATATASGDSVTVQVNAITVGGKVLPTGPITVTP